MSISYNKLHMYIAEGRAFNQCITEM